MAWREGPSVDGDGIDDKLDAFRCGDVVGEGTGDADTCAAERSGRPEVAP